MTTIRHRVLLALVLTGIVPLVALLFLTDFMIGSAIRKSEEEKIVNLNEAVAAHVSALMKSASEDLQAMQTNRLLNDSTTDQDTRLREMRRLVEVYDFISDISLYDGDGFLVSSTTEDYPRYRDHSSTFNTAHQKLSISFSRPYREVGKEGLFLSVYLPIARKETEVFQHMIVARLNYERIVNLVSEVTPGEAGRIVLLDAWGNILSGGSGAESLLKFDEGLDVRQWEQNPRGMYEDGEGNRFLYDARVIGPKDTRVDSPWILVSLVPAEEIDALLGRSQMTVFVVAVATLALASVLGWIISLRLSRPLVDLSLVAQKVAGGDLSAKAEGRGSVEIIQLASSFNQMVEELAEHREGLEKLVLSRTESLRRSQSELERTSARLQSAINSTNNGFLVEDLEGDVVVVNQLFLDLLKIDQGEMQGNPADAVLRVFDQKGRIPDGGFQRWRERRDSGEVIDCEVRLTLPDARTLHVFSAPICDRRGKPVGRVWNTQDLTGQRQLEESLRQSQKMEAVGQLAGGIAHDFNNLLTGILGNLALVELELETRGDLECQENLDFAIKAGDRAADLVKQLLGFSRRSQMNLKPCDANLVLGEVRDILMATIDRRIEINLDLEERPRRVMADLGLLSQVIMNMAVNAKDAMPDGGSLTLRSRNCTIEAGDKRHHADASSGEFICLSIEDDGEGIPPELQKRVFEPFFTTKAPGKGTGLGLATSFGIIKQLGGWIEMDSRPGEGTRFDIYLPRSAAAEAQPVRSSIVAKPGRIVVPRSVGVETILVVDDEEIVRRVARTLLDKLGYQVLEARDGLEALEVFEQNRDKIDLLLLDLTMPNLSGKETFRRLREDGAEVPVLICSGYLVDVSEFAEECGVCPDGFVQKPYRVEDLSAAVRKTLDGRSKAA